jgi:hypothetical protein
VKRPRANRGDKAVAKPHVPRDPKLLNRRPPHDQTSAQFGAAMLVDGLVPHAVVAREWARAPMGTREKMDLTSTVEKIEETARRVSAGDLSHAEAVLTAQTVTLNAMFANLACRATCETLALLKNPPVFARQANIASQQLVNNGTMVAASRAGSSENARNKLLEAHGERLDGGEASQAVERHPALAAVGALNRPADASG